MPDAGAFPGEGASESDPLLLASEESDEESDDESDEGGGPLPFLATLLSLPATEALPPLAAAGLGVGACACGPRRGPGRWVGWGVAGWAMLGP